MVYNTLCTWIKDTTKTFKKISDNGVYSWQLLNLILHDFINWNVYIDIICICVCECCIGGVMGGVIGGDISGVIDKDKWWSRSLYPFVWKERSNGIHVLCLYPFCGRGDRMVCVRYVGIHSCGRRGQMVYVWYCLVPTCWSKKSVNGINMWISINICVLYSCFGYIACVRCCWYRKFIMW